MYYPYSRNMRDDLDDRVKTIKFKTLWPNFKEWKRDLKKYGVESSVILESDFLLISTMTGGSYLKYKTGDKNRVYTAFKFNQLYKIRKRNLEIYILGIDEWLKSSSINSSHSSNGNNQKLYEVNRSSAGEVSIDFLNNAITDDGVAENSSKNDYYLAKINYLNDIIKVKNMVDPDIQFITNLVNSIVYPLQPTQIQKMKRGSFENI